MTFDPTLVVGPELLAQHGIGVVAPFDFALDRELWRWTPDDVSLYMTRLPYVPVPVTVEMASALSDQSIVRQATRDVLAPSRSRSPTPARPAASSAARPVSCSCTSR